jgi:hypothetical protein
LGIDSPALSFVFALILGLSLLLILCCLSFPLLFPYAFSSSFAFPLTRGFWLLPLHLGSFWRPWCMISFLIVIPVVPVPTGLRLRLLLRILLLLGWWDESSVLTVLPAYQTLIAPIGICLRYLFAVNTSPWISMHHQFFVDALDKLSILRMMSTESMSQNQKFLPCQMNVTDTKKMPVQSSLCSELALGPFL